MLLTTQYQNRFYTKKQLGQGSFSTIYSALDKVRKEVVALKVEKADKSKKILMFEYQVLKSLQGLSNICPVYEFIESDQPNSSNFIVMKMLGKNLANLKKQKGKNFTPIYAIKLLLQMLNAIEKVHDMGYIHRDIKPSNFVMGKGKTREQVFIVDFGLGKVHLNKDGYPVEQRQTADFRGTVAYASLNAHNKIDLSRRDDLWSWYFVVLDFLNEQLPWRCCKNSKVDEVKEVKTRCLADPEKHIWRTTTLGMVELRQIFYHIAHLQYSDRPDYAYIRERLNVLLQKEEVKEQSLRSNDTRTSKKRKCPSVLILNTPIAPPNNKMLKEEQECEEEGAGLAVPGSPQTPSPLVLENFGFCMPQRLPYPYPFYGYPRHYPFCADSGFPVPLRTTPRANEEQKEMLPQIPPGYFFPGSGLAIPLPYHHAPPVVPTFCQGQEVEKPFFRVDVNQGYYEKLYGKANAM